MKTMTEQSKVNALGGESHAQLRYLLFAHDADQEGYANVARLFRAVAFAEFIDADDPYREVRNPDGGCVAHAMATIGAGNTKKNLGLAISGETFAISETVHVLADAARLQSALYAVRSFEWSFGGEKGHRELFIRAKAAVDRGEDVQLQTIRVCEICGFTIEGKAPERCPLCQVAKGRFRAFAPA